MKKFLFSFFLFLSFGAFVIYDRIVRVESSEQGILQKNTQLTNTPSLTNSVPTEQLRTTPVVMPPSTGMMKKPVMGMMYKDGSYIGSVEDVYYGNVQVKAVISGGKIVDVIFLDHPSGREYSDQVNAYAMPLLKSEAIQIQNAQVDGVSGASATSGGFRKSLGNALAQAKL